MSKLKKYEDKFKYVHLIFFLLLDVEPEFLDELMASGQHDKFAECKCIYKYIYIYFPLSKITKNIFKKFHAMSFVLSTWYPKAFGPT